MLSDNRQDKACPQPSASGRIVVRQFEPARIGPCHRRNETEPEAAAARRAAFVETYEALQRPLPIFSSNPAPAIADA